MAQMLRKQLLDTSRGRIVTLLQAGELTAEDIATKLGLTRSAVRIQITAMERDGVVRKVGKRPGTTRPSHLFELTPEVEQFLSKAYVPVLTHLVERHDSAAAGFKKLLSEHFGHVLPSKRPISLRPTVREAVDSESLHQRWICYT
jgi:predicted ArsR family transcriptional regulator